MTGPPVTGRWIGRPELRREDRRLVSGQGRFVGTMSQPGTAHLVLVRSPLAHARVLGVDASAAARMPGVVAVLTAADLGPLAPMPVNPAEGADVVAVSPPPLATGRVRFAGEAVAAVVAETPAAAEDAAEAVEVEYDPLPVVATPDEALRADAAVHDEAPDNVLLRWRGGDGDVDAAFAAAAHVVRGRFEMPRLVAVPIETRGALASYDAADDLLTMWLSSQDTHRPLAQLSAVLGRPPERIRVVVPDVGGAFGSKGALATEAVVAAIAAMRLGRPVRWIEDRSENFLAAYQGRGFRAHAELAVGADGRFLAVRARLLFDLGAYLFPNTAFVPVTAAVLVIGAYATPAANVEVVGVATNRVPTGPYRGAGRPEGAYVAERLADLAARELGLDPAEIRRRNLIAPDRFPYTTPLGLTYDSGQYAAALDRACERIGYDRRRAEQGQARAEGRLVGLGLSVTIERAGTGLWESGAVEVEPGGDVIVRTGSSAHGQGHETTFAQIAADVLGIDVGRVRVDAGDSAEVPEGVGTFGSRSVTVGGSAVFEAATAVRDEACRIAARMLGVEGGGVDWREGAAVAAGREVTLGEIAAAAAADPGAPRLSAQAQFTLPGLVFPYGAYAVAIEIDPATGALSVERIVAVDDAGRLVNPLLAEGQVIGATVQGLGQALWEEMVHDEDGQPLTGNLTLYGIAGAPEVPPIESEFLQTPSPFNPLGAKGVGESGSIALPAALANAVADALGPLGVTHLDPPYTPEKLWRAIRHAPRGG
jgi:aerobic carbon-monoxide dehydrogenase large subunit